MLGLHTNPTKTAKHFLGDISKHEFSSVRNRTKYYYDSGNRVTLLTKPGSVVTFRGYDAAGNTDVIDDDGNLPQGQRTLTYNYFNRFSQYSDGSITATYTHNAFGERQIKDDGTTTTRFLYSGPSLLHEQTGGSLRDYIYVGGEIVALVNDGVLYFVHNDHLGRPEVVTDGNQAVVWSSENNAFGNNPGTDLIGGLNLGFPGQYYDIESGTYYNYFRTYDATTGRYLQSDPIGLAGGLNSSGYAFGNPVRFSDPYGIVPPQLIGAGVGALIGGVSGAVTAMSGPNPSFKSVATATIVGAGGGAVAGATLQPQSAIAAGVAAGMAGNLGGQVLEKGDISEVDVVEMAIYGGVGGTGAVTGIIVRTVAPRAVGSLTTSSIGIWGETGVAASVELAGDVLITVGQSYESQTVIITPHECRLASAGR
jgi:RHS repeat-associated protein